MTCACVFHVCYFGCMYVCACGLLSFAARVFFVCACVCECVFFFFGGGVLLFLFMRYDCSVFCCACAFVLIDYDI